MTPEYDSLESKPRLAVYGTLQPGGPNEHILSTLVGRWFEGFVRGRLLDRGWGAGAGYPGIRLDDSAECVAVMVLESSELPMHWSRLDAFEGPEYQRVMCQVEADGAKFEAFIYELKPS